MGKGDMPSRDILVTCDDFIAIRYEPVTDRAFVTDYASGEMIVMGGDIIVDAADTIEVLRKSAL